jgi:4-amino-4-deoxy-L-arabinose transferase-like glycosyltransferase
LNAPLMKLMVGAAPRLMVPDLDPAELDGWEGADQWTFGQSLLSHPQVDLERIVFWGRLPVLLLFMSLVLGGYLFARELYGQSAAYVAAILCALSPSLLAHGRLASTDMGVACFVFWATYACWRLLRRPGVWRLALAGAACGLAISSKFTALVLLPALVVWGAGAVFFPGQQEASEGRLQALRENRRGRLLVFGGALVLVVLVAGFVTTLAWFSPGDLGPFFASISGVYGNMNLEYGEYLHGEFSRSGSALYFVVAFLVKTPLAVLLLTLWRMPSLLTRKAERWRTHLQLLLPAAGMVALASLSAIQYGVRYLLPVYPLLFVWIAGLTRSKALTKPPGRLILAGLLAWFVGSSVASYPDYLPYFNEVAGGADGGIGWLDDSNIDWGQDLVQLRDYLEEHGSGEVWLTTMTRYSPELYGIDAHWVTLEAALHNLDPAAPQPGTHAVSVHLLNRVPFWYEDPPVDPLRDLEPTAIVGHTFYVYEIGR